MPTRDRWENTGNAMNGPSPGRDRWENTGNVMNGPSPGRDRVPAIRCSRSRGYRADRSAPRTRALPTPIKTPCEVANFSHPDQSKLSCGKTVPPVREIVRRRSNQCSTTPILRHSTSPLATPLGKTYPRRPWHTPCYLNLKRAVIKGALARLEGKGYRGSGGNVGNLRESKTNRAVSFFVLAGADY